MDLTIGLPTRRIPIFAILFNGKFFYKLGDHEVGNHQQGGQPFAIC
jgi:hypothetical protein